MARYLTNATPDKINFGTNIQGPAALTMALWFCPPSNWASLPAYLNIAVRRIAGNANYSILSGGSSKLSYYWKGNAAFIDPGSITLSAGKWAHLAASYDSVSGLQTWVNAVSNGTAAPSGGGLGNDIGKSLCIGQEVDAAINGVAGSTYVDFALWNVTLTQNEIMLLSFGVRPLFIRPEALIGYWPITGLGLYETDKSSYGNNGTVIGGALAPDPPFLARNIILGSPDEGEMSMLPGPPALRQKHFRFRTDTAAADATPTWGALEDAN